MNKKDFGLGCLLATSMICATESSTQLYRQLKIENITARVHRYHTRIRNIEFLVKRNEELSDKQKSDYGFRVDMFMGSVDFMQAMVNYILSQRVISKSDYEMAKDSYEKIFNAYSVLYDAGYKLSNETKSE